MAKKIKSDTSAGLAAHFNKDRNSMTPLLVNLHKALLSIIADQPGVKGLPLRNAVSQRVVCGFSSMTVAIRYLRETSQIAYVKTDRGCGYYLKAVAPDEEDQPMLHIKTNAEEMPSSVFIPKFTDRFAHAVYLLGCLP